VERIAIQGDRIDREGVLLNMRSGSFLVHEENGSIVGCVYVQKKENRCYLGLLSVAPSRQGTGIGKELVTAAEEFAMKESCVTMDLRIISARSEIMQTFYEKLGYVVTGTSPLPDFVVLTAPCHFIHMSKSLQSPEAS
jgi:ribosomal protein S18 acetylase RimI-like enzyme